MTHRFEFNTEALWTAQNALTGGIGAGSVNPTTGEQYTTTELTQARYRANAYIRTVFYDFFQEQYKAVDMASLLDSVREDLIEATNYASSHELVTPNIYSRTVTHDNATGQQVKSQKVGELEESFYENKGTTTTSRVQNEQAIDFTIHTLLDKYRIVPEDGSGTSTTGRSGFGILAVGY